MKKIILILVLVGTTASSFSQVLDSSRHKLSMDYLQKSKNQKTGAWVLVGIGAALDVAGIITTISNANKEVNTLFGENSQVNHSGEYALYIGGTAALMGSLPLFIASKRNKHKAVSLTFKNELTPELQSNNVVMKHIPSVGFKLSF
jgi:hypothetical protein